MDRKDVCNAGNESNAWIDFLPWSEVGLKETTSELLYVYVFDNFKDGLRYCGA